MKKIIATIFVWATALGFLINSLIAANPTVTTTFADGGLRSNIYTFSFATTLAAVDTAIVGGPGGIPINVDGMCEDFADSLIAIELKSSETTADSIRHIVAVQFSNAAAPTMSYAGGASAKDWNTQVLDNTHFDSVANGAVVVFPKLRYAGQAKWMRVLIWQENDTTDAAQTVTGRIIIPKRQRAEPDPSQW